MVRPILEYGSTVWDPHFNGLNDELENVQKRAARFVTRNYSYETGSMTGILEELKWETLQKRRKDNRLILLYKGLKGKARIPTDDLIPKNRRCRNQHSLVFLIPTASINAYLKSFFPQTIRDWNVLPDSLITSAELSDDCVSKFTSLVRASSANPLVRYCHFGVSPVNYSDSDSDHFLIITSGVISYTSHVKSLSQRLNEFTRAPGSKIHVSKSPHTGG